MVDALHVMLKPASGMCNLRCKYCFYADEVGKREIPNYGMMSLQTLRNVIQKALAQTRKSCTIAFQGGEPTMAGIDFFKKAVAYSKELNTNHCKIQFALQTNGILIDEEWARFLAREHFLVGVSLDGTKELHDANRVDPQGSSTYSRVQNALGILEQHRVEFNILTVLTSSTCRHFGKIYGYYQRNHWSYQQYIPCLDPLGEMRGKHPWSLSPKRYEQYLKTAFDCWYQDVMKGEKVYHRYFENLLLMLNGQPPEACGMSGCCSMQYVVEADGSVFPCDFYMLDAYRLGNLNTDSFEQLDQKRREIKFIEDSAVVDESCQECRWYPLCRSGCRRDRDYFEDGLGKNYYCEAYRNFFEYAMPRLQQAYFKILE